MCGPASAGRPSRRAQERAPQDDGLNADLTLPTNPRIGPAFYLRRSDDLFRLMGVECAGARGPALGRICIANSLASISDLKVRVERAMLSAFSLVLSGPKVTYQMSP